MKQIKYKLIFVMVGLCAFMALVLGSYNIWSVINNKNFAVNEYRQVLNGQFDRTIRLETETAVSMVNNIYKQQQQSLLTEEQAKLQAARLLRELRFDKDSYFWADTPEGINVVLLGRDTEGKSRINAKDANGIFYMQEIIKNGMKDGGGYTEYWFPKPNEQQATPKRGYSLLFKPYNWVIGTGNWVDDIDKLVVDQEKIYNNAMIKDILFTSALIVLVLIGAVMVTWHISRKISDPIIEMSSIVRKIAMGDLCNTLNIDSQDEIGELGKAVNVMTGDLRGLIKHLATSAEQLAASSEEMTAGAEQSAQASNQVALSITEVAERVTGQLALVDSAVAVVDRISKEIQQFATNTMTVSASATKTEQAANDGETSIEKAISQMRTIEHKTNETAKVIGELEEKSKQIGRIVESITAIAGKTNLLTRNAAIEATESGGNGKGLSAVADEVGKLAEESQAFGKQITALVTEMQQKTNHAVRFMNENKQEVSTGSEVVSLAGKSFRGIIQMVKEITTQIYELSVATQQVAHESENVLNAVLGIDEESKKIAEQTETVSAATQEQSASMEEIASSSQALAHLAIDLHEAVIKFKI